MAAASVHGVGGGGGPNGGVSGISSKVLVSLKSLNDALAEVRLSVAKIDSIAHQKLALDAERTGGSASPSARLAPTVVKSEQRSAPPPQRAHDGADDSRTDDSRSTTAPPAEASLLLLLSSLLQSPAMRGVALDDAWIARLAAVVDPATLEVVRQYSSTAAAAALTDTSEVDAASASSPRTPSSNTSKGSVGIGVSRRPHTPPPKSWLHEPTPRSAALTALRDRGSAADERSAEGDALEGASSVSQPGAGSGSRVHFLSAEEGGAARRRSAGDGIADDEDDDEDDDVVGLPSHVPSDDEAAAEERLLLLPGSSAKSSIVKSSTREGRPARDGGGEGTSAHEASGSHPPPPSHERQELAAAKGRQTGRLSLEADGGEAAAGADAAAAAHSLYSPSESAARHASLLERGQRHPTATPSPQPRAPVSGSAATGHQPATSLAHATALPPSTSTSGLPPARRVIVPRRPRRSPPAAYAFPRYSSSREDEEAGDASHGIPYAELVVTAGELLALSSVQEESSAAAFAAEAAQERSTREQHEVVGRDLIVRGLHGCLDPVSMQYVILDDEPAPAVELGYMLGDAPWMADADATDESAQKQQRQQQTSGGSPHLDAPGSSPSHRTGPPDPLNPAFEAFSLRVVYEAGRTGFEDVKDLALPLGSVLAGRFLVHDYVGSAAFSSALACLDTATGQDVCLKVIKNNKDFVDQSLDEIKLLRYISAASNGDPDKFHVLKMLDYFYHREHLFLVTGTFTRTRARSHTHNVRLVWYSPTLAHRQHSHALTCSKCDYFGVNPPSPTTTVLITAL